MSRAEGFVDTNILIHFKPLDEIDWLALTGASDVMLTIPAKVIAELDEKKELGETKRLRKRAQDAIRRLREWKDRGGVVRPGVTLRLVADEPPAAWSDLGLDPDVPDDRIIAALITQRRSSTDRTFMVTADYGPELKCESRGIRVLSLPSDHRLPDLMGEVDQEVGQLRQRVAQLEDREPNPKLELIGPSGRGQYLEINLRRPADATGPDIGAEVESELVALGGLERGDTSLVMPADPSDLQRFRNEVTEYLQDYRAYLQAKRDYEIATALTVKLECVVKNEGRGPAEGLQVALHVPDGPDVLDKDSVTEEPQSPERPASPRSTMQLLMDRMDLPSMLGPRSFDFLNRPVLPGGDSLSPRIKKTNSFEIEYAKRELVHNFEVRFEPFYCVFRTPESVKSFAIDYEIHAKNLAEPARGQVHVILKLEQNQGDADSE